MHPVLGCVARSRPRSRAWPTSTRSSCGPRRRPTALLAPDAGWPPQVEELRGRVLVAADDVAAADGARDPAAWLAHHARLDGVEARASLRLARAADRWAGSSARALRDGEHHPRPGRGDRPARSTRCRCEVDDQIRRPRRGAAGRGGGQVRPPQRSRVLGRRVLDVVSPPVGEEHERRLLEREEARAARATYLTTRCNGDGTTDLRVRVSDSLAQRLLTYLEAFTSSRDGRGVTAVPTPNGSAPPSAPSSRAVDPRRLPLHGGDATTRAVDRRPGDPAHRAGHGCWSVTSRSPPGRRDGSPATPPILPAVLGGDSELLDLGRASRLFRPPQRKALALQFPTCAADGCDVPAAWCEAHHAGRPWVSGGTHRSRRGDAAVLASITIAPTIRGYHLVAPSRRRALASGGGRQTARRPAELGRAQMARLAMVPLGRADILGARTDRRPSHKETGCATTQKAGVPGDVPAGGRWPRATAAIALTATGTTYALARGLGPAR